MSELDKLEQYLKEKEIPYERIDQKGVGSYVLDRHQIIVYDCYGITGHRLWDAICHWGSYGYEEGLLEVMGDAVVRESDGDSVCGFLTAKDVIDRLEGKE